MLRHYLENIENLSLVTGLANDLQCNGFSICICVAFIWVFFSNIVWRLTYKTRLTRCRKEVLAWSLAWGSFIKMDQNRHKLENFYTTA